jgi:hypothetical protein
MIVLKEIGTAQTVRFVPTRRNAGNRLFLKNETTNVEVEYSITCTQVSYYLTFSKILNLEEGHFYTMVIKQDDELIFRDKVFCTNQTIGTYSVNKDEYVQNDQNIIFYE